MASQYEAQDLQLAFNGGTPVLASAPDYGRGLAFIDDTELEAVSHVLQSRRLSRYDSRESTVARFERKLATAVDCPHTLACASGTAAMRLALAALAVRPGDEVLIPAISSPAVADAVVAQGAVPVFVDVDESFTMDPFDAEAKMGLGTRGLIAVHAFGVACDIDQLLELVQRNALIIIEDATQALGASYEGQMLGSRGYCSVFSFGAEGNISAGEGGALTLQDAINYERAVRYHDHGGAGSLRHGPAQMIGTRPAFWGENLRMGELLGAVLDAQMDKLPAVVQGMAAARRALILELKELGVEPAYDSPRADFSQCVILRTKSRAARDLCVRALRAEGIPAQLLFGGKTAYDADHVLGARTINGSSQFGCSNCGIELPGYSRGLCPTAEELLSVCISIPVGPKYSRDDVRAIAKGVCRVLSYADRLKINAQGSCSPVAHTMQTRNFDE
jgi:8-amino-3,8-dideoxy-alpha-D-manno-octulosonate transaminase